MDLELGDLFLNLFHISENVVVVVVVVVENTIIIVVKCINVVIVFTKQKQ